jgi:ADP-ribosylglycohydrolase
MKTNTAKESAMGAIMGTLIGDALGMGPHWYYDLDLLKEDYGEWIDDYTSRKAGRYHAGLTAGENSQTGQVVGFLLESVGALGSYDESDFCLRLDALLATLDGNPPAGRYTDAAMRDVWHARQAGQNWHRAGRCADTAEAAIRTPVVAARYHNDFPKLLAYSRSNVLLTHQDPFIAGQSVAFGLIVLACTLGFMLPAAYYFNSRFENDFELPVLSAVNGGGNNMARASLTGALLGRCPGGIERHSAAFYHRPGRQRASAGNGRAGGRGRER